MLHKIIWLQSYSHFISIILIKIIKIYVKNPPITIQIKDKKLKEKPLENIKGPLCGLSNHNLNNKAIIKNIHKSFYLTEKAPK